MYRGFQGTVCNGVAVDDSGALLKVGARCSSVVRVFAHGAMGRQIDPSWWSEM